MDMTQEQFTDFLAHFNDRGDALLDVYNRDPERFKPYQDSLGRAQKHLDIAERDELANLSRLADRRRDIEAACTARILTADEAQKILARHEFELSTPLIAQAQESYQMAWEAFWDALRVAEHEGAE